MESRLRMSKLIECTRSGRRATGRPFAIQGQGPDAIQGELKERGHHHFTHTPIFVIAGKPRAGVDGTDGKNFFVVETALVASGVGHAQLEKPARANEAEAPGSWCILVGA